MKKTKIVEKEPKTISYLFIPFVSHKCTYTYENTNDFKTIVRIILRFYGHLQPYLRCFKYDQDKTIKEYLNGLHYFKKMIGGYKLINLSNLKLSKKFQKRLFSKHSNFSLFTINMDPKNNSQNNMGLFIKLLRTEMFSSRITNEFDNLKEKIENFFINNQNKYNIPEGFVYDFKRRNGEGKKKRKNDKLDFVCKYTFDIYCCGCIGLFEGRTAIGEVDKFFKFCFNEQEKNKEISYCNNLDIDRDLPVQFLISIKNKAKRLSEYKYKDKELEKQGKQFFFVPLIFSFKKGDTFDLNFFNHFIYVLYEYFYIYPSRFLQNGYVDKFVSCYIVNENFNVRKLNDFQIITYDIIKESTERIRKCLKVVDNILDPRSLVINISLLKGLGSVIINFFAKGGAVKEKLSKLFYIRNLRFLIHELKNKVGYPNAKCYFRKIYTSKNNNGVSSVFNEDTLKVILKTIDFVEKKPKVFQWGLYFWDFLKILYGNNNKESYYKRMISSLEENLFYELVNEIEIENGFVKKKKEDKDKSFKETIVDLARMCREYSYNIDNHKLLNSTMDCFSFKEDLDLYVRKYCSYKNIKSHSYTVRLIKIIWQCFIEKWINYLSAIYEVVINETIILPAVKVEGGVDLERDRGFENECYNNIRMKYKKENGFDDNQEMIRSEGTNGREIGEIILKKDERLSKVRIRHFMEIDSLCFYVKNKFRNEGRYVKIGREKGLIRNINIIIPHRAHSKDTVFIKGYFRKSFEKKLGKPGRLLGVFFDT